jgi:hypothetical protein
MKFGFGVAVTTIAILFFAPWGLLVATTYCVVVAVQRYRNQTEESGENFENKNSLGLPFTSRW